MTSVDVREDLTGSAVKHGAGPGMTSAPAVQPLEGLITAFDGDNVERGHDFVVFDAPEAVIEANAKEGAARLRIRACLGTADATCVERWVQDQPQPRSGRLQVLEHEDGSVEPRLLFERPTNGTDWRKDPLLDEVRRYAAAWQRDERVSARRRSPVPVAADPRDSPASSAWLLLGSGPSYPSPEELAESRAEAHVGIFDYLWTAAKQTLVGDLAVIYFQAPHKAAHFVTRAASNAFFARDIEVNADGPVAAEQHWAYFTSPIEIEPIPYATLQAAARGHLILRGRSGKFLDPDTIQGLSFTAKASADKEELEHVLTTPVGLAQLPRPEEVDVTTWRRIAAGALPLEAHVSSHLVDPLLRLTLSGTGLGWAREHRVRGGSVDFVVTDTGEPVAAIEVKLVTAEPQGGDWSTSKDFRQLRRYTDALRVPGMLVDAHRVLLVEHGATQPHRVIWRRSASVEDIEAIRRHLVRR